MKPYKSQFNHEPEREPDNLLRFICQTIVCMAVGLLILSMFLPALN